MQIFGGFINYEDCTFNIYTYEYTEDQEGNIIFDKSVPTGIHSSNQMLEARLFHNGTTRQIEIGQGYVKYSKHLEELEDWLNSHRTSQINELKEKLNKYESNPVKIIEGAI